MQSTLDGGVQATLTPIEEAKAQAEKNKQEAMERQQREQRRADIANQPGQQKLAMSKAWTFLKATRQTELGEFHPDLPSSYGPVTMTRWHPKMGWYMEDRKLDLEGLSDAGKREKIERLIRDKKLHPPAERLIHTGLIGSKPHPDAVDWERGIVMEHGFTEPDMNYGIVPFDLFEDDGKGRRGSFVSPPDAPLHQHINTAHRKWIGIRLPAEITTGQFRNEGDMGEPAEAYLEQDIPPERLVQMPSFGTDYFDQMNWQPRDGREALGWSEEFQPLVRQTREDWLMGAEP